MIASCMRYWTIKRRAMAGPCRAIKCSKRLIPKPSACASRLTHGRRQLAVVPGKHDPLAPQQRDPATGLHALRRLVDDR